MTQILRFEMNVPAEVTLKDSGPGKPIEGRYGNRVMYTLADDRVMYVAPIVASRISDLGIQPGELFQVCKQIKRQGPKRLIEWQVQRLKSEPDTGLENELRKSIEVAHAAKAPQASGATENPNPQPPLATHGCGQTMPAILAPNSAVIAESNGTPNGSVPSTARNEYSPVRIAANLENAPETAMTTDDNTCAKEGNLQKQPVPSDPAPVPAIVPIANNSTSRSPSSAPQNQNGNTPAPVTTKLEHALKTAISAAYNAEKYGADLGYVVRFDADAIKSMAITVLINMSEGNRR